MNKDRVKQIEAIQNWGHDNGYTFVCSEADDLLNRILEPEAKPEPEMMICPEQSWNTIHGVCHSKLHSCNDDPKCIPYAPEAVKESVELPEEMENLTDGTCGNFIKTINQVIRYLKAGKEKEQK